MTQFASYIDRQKSGPGSSEKSQKVHSANWKEEIQLQKALDCLRKQEQQRISRISSDQRIVVHRFQRKLSASVDIAKKHEKVKESLDKSHIRTKELRELQRRNPDKDRMSITQLRCLSASPKPPLPKFRRTKSCEPFEESNTMVYSNEISNQAPLDLTPRPMTALEKRNKMWERQLKTVTQRFNRARSAPTKTNRLLSDFSSGQVKASRERESVRRQNRAVTNIEVDIEYFRRIREKELCIHRQAVKAFLSSIQPLELVTWTPGYYKPLENNNETENEAHADKMMNSEEYRQERTYSVASYSQDTKDKTDLGKTRTNKLPITAWT
ncbi:uncharacterized protein [Montipora foliosa]|uniref:uncharacterized protein n=1 Tax=Montipora foliosa TaxID=591990 RepID=UPI0035F142D5